MEKALFRAHPEFERSRRLSAAVIAPGQMLVSIADEPSVVADDDPVIDAFLAFLASDMERHPERIAPLSSGSIARAVELTNGITVEDDDVFPDDVTV